MKKAFLGALLLLATSGCTSYSYVRSEGEGAIGTVLAEAAVAISDTFGECSRYEHRVVEVVEYLEWLELSKVWVRRKRVITEKVSVR